MRVHVPELVEAERGVTLDVATGDAVTEATAAVLENDGDALCDCGAERDRETVGVFDKDDVAVPECVRDGVAVLAPERLTVCEADCVEDVVSDIVGLCEGVELRDRVRVNDAVCTSIFHTRSSAPAATYTLLSASHASCHSDAVCGIAVLIASTAPESAAIRTIDSCPIMSCIAFPV